MMDYDYQTLLDNRARRAQMGMTSARAVCILYHARPSVF